MNRRNFLGSLFGMIVTTPFLVKLISDPQQRKILPYTMGFREQESNLIIQAPGIKSIDRIKDGFIFIPEELEISQPMIIKNILLYDDHGTLIAERPFHSSVPMAPGDKLKATYSLTANRHFNSPEELTELAIKYWNNK